MYTIIIRNGNFHAEYKAANILDAADIAHINNFNFKDDGTIVTVKKGSEIIEQFTIELVELREHLYTLRKNRTKMPT